MKVLFMRHGESVDDLTDQYGGWADFDLTPKGRKQIKGRLREIKKLSITFEKVLTSPLNRARETAKIVGNTFSIPVESFVYLKEKNGYGLLSGMNKEFAKESYPELVGALDTYVPGSESQEKFDDRVTISVSLMLRMGVENLIAVTHNGYFSSLYTTILGKKKQNTGDGGFTLVEFEKDGSGKILETFEVEYE